LQKAPSLRGVAIEKACGFQGPAAKGAKFPVIAEQGIVFTEQGIFVAEAGN
jgi:hypothetical protein